MIIGYAAGAFDMFHIGHRNLLQNAKSLCDRLIVGVSTDELIKEYKGITPTIPFSERCEIVRSSVYADLVVPQVDMNKMEAWKRYKFDIMLVGDDWYGTAKWKEYDIEFAKVGVRIIYIPYTKHISSTHLRKILSNKELEEN